MIKLSTCRRRSSMMSLAAFVPAVALAYAMSAAPAEATAVPTIAPPAATVADQRQQDVAELRALAAAGQAEGYCDQMATSRARELYIRLTGHGTICDEDTAGGQALRALVPASGSQAAGPAQPNCDWLVQFQGSTETNALGYRVSRLVVPTTSMGCAPVTAAPGACVTTVDMLYLASNASLGEGLAYADGGVANCRYDGSTIVAMLSPNTAIIDIGAVFPAELPYEQLAIQDTP